MNWESIDWGTAITNALLIGVLVELVTLNTKIRKDDD